MPKVGSGIRIPEPFLDCSILLPPYYPHLLSAERVRVREKLSSIFYHKSIIGFIRLIR
jgi:hypothetical protein